MTARPPGNPVPKRADIERALDELVAFEEGFRFQNLAVILGKRRWPDLIASERKWDHGLDAHALPERGLATSITPTLAKIRKDATRARSSFPDLRTLIFYTPRSVTNHTVLAITRKRRNLDFRRHVREAVRGAIGRGDGPGSAFDRSSGGPVGLSGSGAGLFRAPAFG